MVPLTVDEAAMRHPVVHREESEALQRELFEQLEACQAAVPLQGLYQEKHLNALNRTLTASKRLGHHSHNSLRLSEGERNHVPCDRLH